MPRETRPFDRKYMGVVPLQCLLVNSTRQRRRQETQCHYSQDYPRQQKQSDRGKEGFQKRERESPASKGSCKQKRSPKGNSKQNSWQRRKAREQGRSSQERRRERQTDESHGIDKRFYWADTSATTKYSIQIQQFQ